MTHRLFTKFEVYFMTIGVYNVFYCYGKSRFDRWWNELTCIAAILYIIHDLLNFKIPSYEIWFYLHSLVCPSHIDQHLAINVNSCTNECPRWDTKARKRSNKMSVPSHNTRCAKLQKRPSTRFLQLPGSFEIHWVPGKFHGSGGHNLRKIEPVFTRFGHDKLS